MSRDYSAYIWYHIIVDVTLVLACFIAAIIILKTTDNHICWTVGLVLIPILFIGGKTVKAFGEE